MNKRISDMMDELSEEIEVAETELFDASRVSARTMAKLHAEKKSVFPRRRVLRTALIAAVMTCLIAAMAIAASAGDARGIVEGIRSIFGGAEVYTPGEGEIYVDTGPNGYDMPPIARHDVGIILHYEVAKETHPVVYKVNWLPGQTNWSNPLDTWVEDRFNYPYLTYNRSWIEEESPADREGYIAALGLPEEEWKDWNAGYLCRSIGGKGIQFYVDVLSGAWLYERDMVIGQYGGEGKVEREWTDGDYSCIELTMDYTVSDNPGVRNLGVCHYLLLFNEKDGYLVEIAGTIDVAELEKIAENMEFHVTGITQRAAEAPEDVWYHGLIDVGVG